MASSDRDAIRGTLLAALISVSTLGIFGAIGTAIIEFVSSSERAIGAVIRWKISRGGFVPMYARALGPGTIVQYSDLTAEPYFMSLLPSNIVIDPELIVGQTLTERVLEGDLVRPERFAATGAGLDALLPTGARAIALDLDPESYTAGAMAPGYRVDVIVTLPGEEDGPQTVTLVYGVRVLAVNEWISETARGEEIEHRQVTLAVGSVDVERLAHASAVRIGAIYLSVLGEREVSLAAPRASDEPPLAGKRMTISEFEDTFTSEEVDEMYERWLGQGENRLPIIDPRLVRDLLIPEDSESVAQ